MGSGNDDGVLVGVGEDARHVEHVLGLEAEVELLHDRLSEQLDQGRWVGQGGHGDAAHQERGDPAHGGEITAHQGGHVGTLHLDDHGLAGLEARRVDLGDRGGGDGCLVELAELLLERHAEVGFDDAADHGKRLGGNPVTKKPELGHELFGEEAFARGDDLSQLDVGGPEAFEGTAQPSRQPGPRHVLATAAVTDVPTGQRRAQDGTDPHHPGPRGEPALPGETGSLGPCPLAQAVDPRVPRQTVEVEDPGWM